MKNLHLMHIVLYTFIDVSFQEEIWTMFVITYDESFSC